MIAGDSGCALGMAFYAVGARSQGDILRRIREEEPQAMAWKWLGNVPDKAPSLCRCKNDVMLDASKNGLGKVDYRCWIAHFFNEHVATGKWTLTKLVDWVRSVEPTEETLSPTVALATRDANTEVVTNG